MTTPSSADPTPPKAPSAQPDARERRSARLAALLVCLAAAALYLPTLWHELVYDDMFLISPQLNRSMASVVDHPLELFDLFGQEYWEGVRVEDSDVLNPVGQALYRPLTLFVWGLGVALQKPLGMTDAKLFHAASLLVNVWVVYLAFVLVRRLFGSTRLAVITSLLYAVHPLHSEAVAYVAGLSDLLSSGAVLLGVILFERATRDRGRLALGAYLGMLVTLFVGLLTKETAVLLIAAVFLTDLMLAASGRAIAAAHRLATYVGLLATLAAHIGLRWIVLERLVPDAERISRLDNPLLKVETGVRALNAVKLVAKYVWLTLWPRDLSIDYSYNAIPVSTSWLSPEPLAGLVLVSMLLLVGLVKLRRQPALGWGLLFFTGCAIFFSNMFMPFGTIFAERLMYLPTLGAALVVALLLDRIVVPDRSTAGLHPVGLLLLVALIGGAGLRTWERNKDFRTATSVFETGVEVQPDSARLHYQLGSLYYSGQLYTRAQAELEHALRIDPTFVQAALRLGEVHLADLNYSKAVVIYEGLIRALTEAESQQGWPGVDSQMPAVRSIILVRLAQARQGAGDLAGAQKDLERAIELSVSPDADVMLVDLLQGQERWAESIPVIEQALTVRPGNVQLIKMLSMAAIHLGDQATYQEALEQLRATDAGRPYALIAEAEVLYENALLDGSEDRMYEAMDLFEEAKSLDDSLATPYVYRGRYMVDHSGSFHDAITEYDRALMRNPRHPSALLHKAIAKLAISQPEDALKILKVLETVNPSVECYFAMSEAYINLGNLDDMEATNEKLRELGEEPVDLILRRSVVYRDQGQVDRAIDILETALVASTNREDPRLWKNLGLLLHDAGRYDEALAAFLQEETTLSRIPEAGIDLFLPIYRSRALLALGRDVEASGQLDQLEAMLASMEIPQREQTQLRASLLHRRAQILLEPGSVLYSPALAESLCDEGLQLTRRRHPPFFDLSIEALVASDDVRAAVLRAREGAAAFPGLPEEALYTQVAEALEQALEGDLDGALTRLRAGENEVLTRIADKLAA